MKSLANPISGGGRALVAFDAVSPILAKDGVKYQLQTTQHPTHAFELARELDVDVYSAIVRKTPGSFFFFFDWGCEAVSEWMMVL